MPPTCAAVPPAPISTRPRVIEVRGVRQNNLKNLSFDLPLGQLCVVTGPSGSGKSSLAFDTIYAEGQRRYVETFSPYTRQFFDRMDKPQVDEIRGIPPAIAIEQSNTINSTRSTVGTVTELNDYFKLLFPRLARAFCPSCQREIHPDTPASVADRLQREMPGQTVLLTFPVPAPAGTPVAEFFAFLQSQGYLRVWLDGKPVRTDDAAAIAAPAQPDPAPSASAKPTRGRKKSAPPAVTPPTIYRVIQDRLALTPENRSRLSESIETAFSFGKGRVEIISPDTGAILPCSAGWHCPHCDLDIRPPSPGLFSFNHPLGACPVCRGFGRSVGVDYDRAMPDHRLSVAQGLVRAFSGATYSESQRDLMAACKHAGINVLTPYNDLPQWARDFIMEGDPEYMDDPEAAHDKGLWYGVKGFFRWLESKNYKMHVRVFLSRYRGYTACQSCRGGRFQPETLNFRLLPPGADLATESPPGLTLPDLQRLPVKNLIPLFEELASQLELEPTASLLLTAILARLHYLREVGLDYLTPDRAARTLSGGEIARVNLTTCLGASLVNTLFVLDEPSIGLHPRDIGRLVAVMRRLRDKGNTLLVVEHEEAVIRAADFLLDIGPGRGAQGGEMVFHGPFPELLASPPPASLTAAYLTGEKSIPLPSKRRTPSGWLRVTNATAHNLKSITVNFPLGVLTCVTGVSGSGKSTLVHHVLADRLRQLAGEPLEEPPGACDGVSIHGISEYVAEKIKDPILNHIGPVVLVDQSQLARTPKSTPAVYLGILDSVRNLFAREEEAKAIGLNASAFSFNSSVGQCPRCTGAGYEKVEMQFLSDIFVLCPECEGRRYQPHILTIKLDGLHSIHDILEMTASQALAYFNGRKEKAHRHIVNPLRLMEEVGLGYIKLGQPLNTLSGGESQRLKLVQHLLHPEGDNALEHIARRSNPARRSLLIFDEPTTGLHFDDIALLLKVLHKLTDEGHSLIVIEHNLEVIKTADHVIDIGPEGGADGGHLLCAGTPEEVALHPVSHTARYLQEILPAPISKSPKKKSNSKKFDLDRGLDADIRSLAAETSPAYLAAAPADVIRVRGAREHNLKNISLDLPRDQMIVVTGLSGSGKSTLAFDLLFAEGQRRFLDSMSPYARQFVEQMERPDVDLVEGLPPTVAIEQRVTRGGVKSTVATVTEIYHFLRLLFAKLGVQHCPKCQIPVQAQSESAISARVSQMAREGGRVTLLAPVIKARKGFHTEVAQWATKKNYERLLVDGKLVRTADFTPLARFKEHSIDAVIAEITAETPDLNLRRLVQETLAVGKGVARLLDHRNKLHVASTSMTCPGCDRSFEELDPRLFSFNSPHGWCPECRGAGVVWNDESKSSDYLAQAEERSDTSILEAELRQERALESADPGETRTCPRCEGVRLSPQAISVRLQGYSLDKFTSPSIVACLALLDHLDFQGRDAIIARDILPEIRQRLRFLLSVGLGYLSLGRGASTLSGGESQRIRLAAQLGSTLSGVLYVLDEPTIGLHPRDNAQLLDILQALKDKGNSLLIVEHDEETMRRADLVLDLGPGAGRFGGEILALAPLRELLASPDPDNSAPSLSATVRCLRHPLVHPSRGARRPVTGDEQTRWLQLEGVNLHNLRVVDARFPVARLTVLTGLSGAGKSTLMRGVLHPAVRYALAKPADKPPRPGTYATFQGEEHLETVYEVDQTPIGKTSRSTPGTYVKVFDDIRALYAQMPLARMRGYTSGRFSFNTEGGRCEACKGNGSVKLEMAFLPPTHILCDSCKGRRYNDATLEVEYQGRSIAQVMDMTIAEARDFFASQPRIHRALALLAETGLGYLRLGQPSPSLSGGESQRIKLVAELARGAGRAIHERIRKNRQPKSTLYLLEEPTIGLHMEDARQLIAVLHRLVDSGDTVIVVEHNLDLIAEADHVIEIGPGAGDQGGQIVATGTPEQIAAADAGPTAPFLREIFSLPALAPVTASEPEIQPAPKPPKPKPKPRRKKARIC